MVKTRKCRKIQGKTKTEHVRDYLSGHPNPKDQTPGAVVDALAEKKIHISRSLVHLVKKSQLKHRGSRKAKKSVVGLFSAAEQIRMAKKFIEEIGGIEKATAAMHAYAHVHR